MQIFHQNTHDANPPFHHNLKEQLRAASQDSCSELYEVMRETVCVKMEIE